MGTIKRDSPAVFDTVERQKLTFYDLTGIAKTENRGATSDLP